VTGASETVVLPDKERPRGLCTSASCPSSTSRRAAVSSSIAPSMIRRPWRLALQISCSMQHLPSPFSLQHNVGTQGLPGDMIDFVDTDMVIDEYAVEQAIEKITVASGSFRAGFNGSLWKTTRTFTIPIFALLVCAISDRENGMSLQPIDYYDCDKLGLPASRPVLQREYKAMDIIARQMPRNKHASILDVGCGDGSFLRQLDKKLSQPYEYHGVDYSEYKVRKAHALPYRILRCNLEEGIPYEDASFDLVYSGEVIEHIYNPDFMLEECRRVLKPGGLLIISTPNLQAWYNRILFLCGIQPLFYEVSTRSSMIGAGIMRRVKLRSVPIGHLRVFNHRGLTDLLKNEGFDVLASTGARFQSLPKTIQIIDSAFNLRPTLASIILITARKK